MEELRKILSELTLYTEGLAALVGILYWKFNKNNYWRYFIIYLVLIFVAEIVGKNLNSLTEYSKRDYYNYIVIPFQFIFLYWLFAVKSLRKNLLFFAFIITYILSFTLSEYYFTDIKLINAATYTFGCLQLMILVVLEYLKQINSTNILKFYQNKMFYITLGVTIFYIGTLPFFSFYNQIYKIESLWKLYILYVNIAIIIMYILFAASFIWGRRNF